MRALARRSGVSYTTVSRMEADPPKHVALRRNKLLVAAALDAQVHELFAGEDEREVRAFAQRLAAEPGAAEHLMQRALDLAVGQ